MDDADGQLIRPRAKRVLVTGGAGFVGSAVVRELLACGHEVVVLDDLSTGSTENLDGLDLDFIEGSIPDSALLARAACGVQAIVHLAARPSVPRSIADPVATHRANVDGTLNVLEQARREADPLVILASSSSVYGSNAALPKVESMVPQPRSPYAASKLAAEQYAMAWQESFGVRALAFRFFNVFGPRQSPGHAYAAVIPAFVWAALRGEALPIHHDGSQSRDFTYVGTVAEVITSAINREVSHTTPVNLAFGGRVSLNELADLLVPHLGCTPERAYLPIRAGDVPHSQADSQLLQSLFPDITPVALADGLAATVEWMRSTLMPAANLQPVHVDHAKASAVAV